MSRRNHATAGRSAAVVYTTHASSLVPKRASHSTAERTRRDDRRVELTEMDLSGIGDDLVVGNVRLDRPFDIVGISILGSHDDKSRRVVVDEGGMIPGRT